MNVEEINKVYECCKDSFHRHCDGCPVTDDCCHDKMPLFVMRYAIELLKEQEKEIDEISDEYLDLGNEMAKQPKPKTGHWQDKDEGIARCSARCSCCKKVSSGFATDNGFSFDYRYHEYCPKCGAKMDNAKEE